MPDRSHRWAIEPAATMNASTGKEKIDAMVTLLNEFVQQRKSMHQMTMKMQNGMLSGMQGDESEGTMTKCKTMMKKTMEPQGAIAPKFKGGGSDK